MGVDLVGVDLEGRYPGMHIFLHLHFVLKTRTLQGNTVMNIRNMVRRVYSACLHTW